MSMEDTIRQIMREENDRHLEAMKVLLESYSNPDAPRTLSVREAAEILGFGINKTYELIQQKEFTAFPVLKSGNRYLIPYHALINWMNQQAKQAN